VVPYYMYLYLSNLILNIVDYDNVVHVFIKM